MNGYVYCDVDGCLLDFSAMMSDVLAERGTPIQPELVACRPHDYFSQSWPEVFTKAQEMEICDEIHRSDRMLTQPSYPELDKDLVGIALRHQRLKILTKVPQTCDVNRVSCLAETFGVDASDLRKRYISVWGEATKGITIAADLLNRTDDIRSSLLVDDRCDNLESLLRLGGKGLLVLCSYNREEAKRLRAVYPMSLHTVERKNLGAALLHFLGGP
jgi:hypothetical protein